MRCPFCGFVETQVKDSRPIEEGVTIRRRRVCLNCQSRFTTTERIQLCELSVVKKDNRKELFSREKLARSIYTAVRKRPVSDEQLERMINALQHRLETMGESEIASQKIGEMVMEVLNNLDPIAYIRFASVYKDFKEAKDFQAFIGDHLDSSKEVLKRDRKKNPKYPTLFQSDEQKKVQETP